jgi:hypothetical protein
LVEFDAARALDVDLAFARLPPNFPWSASLRFVPERLTFCNS